jgi:hypothetical protein
MYVGIGNEATQLHVWEYLNGIIFGTVQTILTATLSKCQKHSPNIPRQPTSPEISTFSPRFHSLFLSGEICFFPRIIQDVLPRGIRRLW